MTSSKIDAHSPTKPTLRGVSHQYAFFVSLLTGLLMVIGADTTRAAIMALIYCASLSALLGTSALYHRVNWSPSKRTWMRRIDHTMIFVLIAGTYTPLAVIKLDGEMGGAVLCVVWSAVVAGALLNLVWVEAPRWLGAMLYLMVGWFAVVTMPRLVENAGWLCVGLIIAGGVLYSLGAAIYVLKRPNPAPKTFGYHELFHALVVAAAACHYAAVTTIL